MSAADTQLPLFHIVGFTGHRQLTDAAGIQQAMSTELEKLRESKGVEWVALSSIAEGSDILFARTARSLGMGWEAMLPLPAAEFRRDFHEEIWMQVENLLGEAEQVRIIGERTARDDSYLDCGMETVNGCDLLLAVWDGEPSRGRGGTAEIVAYARELGRPLILIDAKNLEVRRENMERLRLGDRHLAKLNSLPPAPAENAASCEVDPVRERVHNFQRKVDHAATHGAPHIRKLTGMTLGLHVGATALATAGLAFNLHFALLPWSKLACLVGALVAAMLIRAARDRHDWVRCRLAAEITRSALATWGLPRADRLFGDFDWAGLEPLRRSLDVLQRRAAKSHSANFDVFKQRYLSERIDGQLAYFARQQSKAKPSLDRLRSAFFISSTLAIIFAAGYAINATVSHGEAPDWVQHVLFEFCPIVLPVLAAGFISLISINDLNRRVTQYHEMQVRLTAARKEANFVQTWGSLERVIAKAERALLQEVFEWHSITSFSGESH